MYLDSHCIIWDLKNYQINQNKKLVVSPDYKPNQGNLTTINIGGRIGEVNFTDKLK